MRAYSQAAKLALDAGEVILMENCAVCSLNCTYNQYGKVASIVAEHSSGTDDVLYGADVTIKFHIKPSNIPALEKKLADATAGEAQIRQEKEEFFPTSVTF